MEDTSDIANLFLLLSLFFICLRGYMNIYTHWKVTQDMGSLLDGTDCEQACSVKNPLKVHKAVLDRLP